MLQRKKEELCKIAKMLFDKNLVSGTDGNISIRVDKSSMLITPSGINKGMLEPSMILLQNFEGTVLQGKLKSTKEAEMHSKIYQLRADIQAVIHTHPACATSFAACGIPVPQDILIEVPVLLGETAVTGYARPGSKKLVEEVEKHIIGHDIILLKNHGVITCANSLIGAFNKMDALENAAKTIIYTRLLGGASLIVKEEVEKIKAK